MEQIEKNSRELQSIEREKLELDRQLVEIKNKETSAINKIKNDVTLPSNKKSQRIEQMEADFDRSFNEVRKRQKEHEATMESKRQEFDNFKNSVKSSPGPW